MKSGASISFQCLYKTCMRFLFFILFPAFLVGLGIYGAGSSLPEKIVTIRGVTLPVSPNDLWTQVNDIEKLPEWNANIQKVTVIPKQGENKQLWHVQVTEKQSYILEKTYELAPEALQLSMDESTVPYRFQRDLSLTDKTVKAETKEGENKERTFLKITETAYTPNPFVRFYMNYFIGYDSAVIAYLESIAKFHNASDAEIRKLVA